MKKLIFTGNVKEDKAIGSLIKEVNNISCRMHVDIKNGFLTVENVTDAEIDKVIDLVDNFYSTDSVEIDNVFDDTSSKQEIPILVEEKSAEIVPVTKQESTSKTLEPQSEDDLIINKVEFQNEHIEELTNKFLRTAYWAMYKMNVSEMDIGKFIFSVIDEISMRYTQKDTVEFVLGDIVDVNYGMHLPGEINGKHVNAIVCKITPNNMAYLVPITKVTTDLTSNSYLTFNTLSDVTYYYDSYSDGTALLDKGRYLRIERINKVVGRTKPGFFITLLNKLATTFDFTEVIPKDENIVEPTEKHNEESYNTNISSVSTSKTNSVNKVGKEEAALVGIV